MDAEARHIVLAAQKDFGPPGRDGLRWNAGKDSAEEDSCHMRSDRIVGEVELFVWLELEKGRLELVPVNSDPAPLGPEAIEPDQEVFASLVVEVPAIVAKHTLVVLPERCLLAAGRGRLPGCDFSMPPPLKMAR